MDDTSGVGFKGRVAAQYEQHSDELPFAQEENGGITFVDLQKRGLEAGGAKCGPRCAIFTSLMVISAISILILGALVLAGHMPPATAAFAAIGIAPIGFIAGLLALDKLSKHKWTIIATALMAIAFVVVGALGGAGVLSGAQLGWGLIGTFLAGGILSGISRRIDHRNNPELQQVEQEAQAFGYKKGQEWASNLMGRMGITVAE